VVVEQLGLRAAELEAWLKALKGQLGCGGTVEADTLVLQGDHTPVEFRSIRLTPAK